MILLDRIAKTTGAAQDKLALPFDQRQKARLRVRLTSGAEAAIQLPRGHVMRGGERLVGPDGYVVEIVAAPEPVCTARAQDPRLIARAAYHLGNRHVPLQIGTDYLRYQQDHVLDAMVSELGLKVAQEETGFEPEAGAYGQHGHHHAAEPE